MGGYLPDFNLVVMFHEFVILTRVLKEGEGQGLAAHYS
jgi:hypothetical protein